MTVATLDRLSDVLWTERRLLELLVYRLEVEHFVLTSGRVQWVGQARRDVEAALDQVRTAEVGRAAEADAVARDLDLPDGSGLCALAARAPTSWGDLLRAHRTAMVTCAARIGRMAADNSELLVAGQHEQERSARGRGRSARAGDDLCVAGGAGSGGPDGAGGGW